MTQLLSYLTTAIEEQVAKRGQTIFGTKLKGCRHKVFHVFHSLQSVMAFRALNDASSEKRCPTSISHFRILLCVCFKTSLSAKSFTGKWVLHEFHWDFHANQSHFHKNGFALRLALKQKHRGTRKRSISMHLTSGQKRFSRLQNSPWLIKNLGTPAVRKEKENFEK